MRRPPIRPGALVLALLTIVPSVACADDPPKGDVTKYTFDSSTIFPGTTREYWVYVPKQYDPAKPACLWVNQDGIQNNAPAVFDELISRGEMPVTIGVFITPGRVKAPRQEALDRFNRSYEYDGLGDAYARFLSEELLPDVEKKTAPDGRPIHLSRDGNDRGIGGSSSGAVCAFTAAWERPDSFRRVFSAVGTYVGLRGGNEYSTLIRKVEPKPIRIFLQDGSNDLNSFGGDWWMANQAMERSFAFAGYEVNHVWGEGGHSGEHAAKLYPDALRWLWKGWPEGVKAGEGSQQLKEILIPGEGWALVAEGYEQVTSAATNAKGEVFYNGVPTKPATNEDELIPPPPFGGFAKVYRIALDGQVTEFLSNANSSSAQAFGPDGRLFAVSDGNATEASGRLKIYDTAGKIANMDQEDVYKNLVVRPDGSVFATRYLTGLDYINSDGGLTMVDTELRRPSGIALSPDQTLLYVADSKSHWVYSYQVLLPGTLAYKQKYYHLHVPDDADNAGSGGMKVDRDGRLYVATRMGIQVCDQAGRVNCIIPTPNGKVTDLTFGGPEFDTIYATCGDRVYKRKVKTHGVNAFQAPIKPAAPRL